MSEFASQALEQLLDMATDAALAAGEFIAKFDRAAIQTQTKCGGNTLASQVVTQVDIACEKIIRDKLSAGCEQWSIAFLGEESASEHSIVSHPRHQSAYFWCVDPLDGTLPFIENKPGYAVSIALVSHHGEAKIGVVYNPVTKTLYQGVSGDKARLLKNANTWQPRARQCGKLTAYFDRSVTALPLFFEIKQRLSVIASKLGFSDVTIQDTAGAVMSAIGVIENAPACYFKLPKKAQGGGSLWDFAATSALAKVSCAWVSDMRGKPLHLNPPDTLFMNKKGVLFASDKVIADSLIKAFANLNQD